MVDMERIARKLIKDEVDNAEFCSREEGNVAGYWAELVESILDTNPDAADTVVEFLVGSE